MKKTLTAFLMAAMVMNMSAVPALAQGKSYADGTWSGTATVQPDGDQDFDAYDITVDVQVSGGKITSVSLDPATDADGNEKWLNRAANGRGSSKGVFSQIVENNSTEGIDAVSGATCASNAITEAVDNALAGHEAEETDKTALQTAIDAAEALNSADYTEDSWAAMQTALENARKVMDDADAAQTEIDNAAAALKDAVNALQKPQAEEYVYVKMNIPFDVFYKDITPSVASQIDAVTTATTKGQAQAYIDGGNFYGKSANEIDGVSIPVKLSKSVYDTVRDKVTDPAADYYIGAETADPSVYMEAEYAEGTGFTFSALQGSTADNGTVNITEEWQTKRRDIEIKLDTSKVTGTAADLYGGYVTTTDGTAYPLLPMESMYKASGIKDIGWSLGDKTQQVNKAGALVMNLQPDVFKSMKGKTLDKMTLFTTSGIVSYSLRDQDSGEPVTMTYPAKQDPVYVLMNIPYSEFYAAEGTSDVDAVSSATKVKTRSSLAKGSYHENSDGTDISGIIYPVKVDDPEVLKNLKQVTDSDSVDITVSMRSNETTTTYAGKDALFENADHAYYLLSEMPAYYKELTVGSDGSFSFGKAQGMETEQTVSAELLTGDQTRYGDYQLNFEDYEPDTVYGVLVHTKEGGSYGMKHVENIWRNSEIAFSTGHTTQSHGNPLQVYADAEGQTVDSVTFYTDKGIEKLDLAQEEYLAPVSGSITASADSETAVTVEGLPSDIENAKATVSYRNADRKTVKLADGAEIQNGKVTLTDGKMEEDISYTVTVTSSNYAAMSAQLTYQKPETPAVVDYQIIEGANGTWKQGSNENYKVVSNAPFDKFKEVQIDDQVISSDNYAAAAGSTEIELKATYLQTLSTGQHKIAVVSSDGQASADFTIEAADEKPTDNTGDNTGNTGNTGDTGNTGNSGRTENTGSNANTGNSGSAQTGTGSSASAVSGGSSASAGTAGTSASAQTAGSSSNVKTGDTGFAQAAAGIPMMMIGAALCLFLGIRRKKAGRR